MDARLFAHIQRDEIPPFNLDVTRGLPKRQLAHAEEYVRRIFHCAAPGYPVGFKFIEMMRCTPAEEFAIATAKRSNKASFELTRSDIFLCRLQFEHNGEPLKDAFLYLPFASEAGLITIMGSKFAISPVLGDKAISVSEDGIYIPVNRDKLTFQRLLQHFLLDDRRVSQGVIWSAIHHGGSKRGKGLPTRRTIKANATLAHYLFCKVGLRQAFAMYGAADIVSGTDDEITPEKYPEDKWHICRSTQIKPYGVVRRFYTGTNIRLAIPKHQYNPLTAGLIAGFFYVADRFPERMHPEYLDDHRLWQVLMGHVIFASEESEGKLLSRIALHIESLDGYVDAEVQGWLAEDGIFVNDIYDLFANLIDTYAARVSESSTEGASMYGKRLMVLRYVLIDIIKAIFNMLYALQNAAKKGLTKTEANNIIQKYMKRHLIIRMNHKHSEVSSVSSPSDCMAWKITSNVILQSNIGAGGGSSKSVTVDGSKILHASIAEAGQYNHLPKGEPTGRNRINPYVRLGSDWSIVRNPQIAGFLDSIQEHLQR